MSAETGSLQVEQVPLCALQQDKRNPRRHSKRQIKQLAQSIQTFGFNVPVLVDCSGKIIAGHGRIQGLRSLDYLKSPFYASNISRKRKPALS